MKGIRAFLALSVATVLAGAAFTVAASPAQAAALPAPLDLQITSGNGYLSARWSAPILEGYSVWPLAYSVVARDTVTNKKTWVNVAGDVYQASVTPLVNGRSYEVAVAAWNYDGLGAFSTATTRSPSASALAATSPAAVPSHTLRSWPDEPGTQRLEVGWKPSTNDNGAPIGAYSVVVLQDGKVVKWVHVGRNDRLATVGGVPFGKATTVYVLPSNSRGFNTTALSMTQAADTSHATIVSIENQYPAAVHVVIGDETSLTWDLQPGQSAGAAVLETSYEHGDGGGASRIDNPECGNGDGEDYFAGGHEYRLVVSIDVITCENGYTPALFIYDLTTGGVRRI